MAEAAVGAIIEVMLGKLVTLAEEQISLVRHFKDDLETLRKSFVMVRAFLRDAEKKKVTEEAVKTWLRELEDLAFDADNVIDDIDYILLSKQVKKLTTNKTVKKKVQSLFSCSSPISYRQKMGSRIKVINGRLENIKQLASEFRLVENLGREKDILDAYGDRESDAFSVDPIFLGRENEVSEIVNMLITTSRAGQNFVLPIVGMGGRGKTTFARKIFHDEDIKSHFGEKNIVWVYVSQNFDVRNILKNILKPFLKEENVELDSKQVLLQKLQKHFGGRKYLLVLDDVWNEDRVKWDGFVNSLSGISSANGYGMIVTTRSEEVASIVKKTLDVHDLKGLPEDDCWSIIKAQVLRGGDIPFDVEEIGKSIAKKCQGLPLAANVVGGLLSSMKSKDKWKSIEENWLPNDENPISSVLKLSFDHLPSPSLKKCFAYCSIFPKGHEIDKEQLVELWMAEGFLQTNQQNGNNNIDMETIGSENFNILLRKSLLQCVRSDDYGNVTDCNMHDLLHDLACSVLCENEGVCKSRYIGYNPSGDGLLSIPKGQERYVRTLFFDGKVSDINFSDFESLHTLTLVGKGIDNLPTSIREIKHLRYLDFSKTRIRTLPNSVCELYHLQTLRSPMREHNLSRSYLEKLPDSFSCLISLRHLHVFYKTTLPLEIGKLICLQTLPYFHVGSKKGFEIPELGKLKDLKGKLEIRNLEKVRDKTEATSAGLLQKPRIYELKLVWDREREGDEENDESVLEGLEPLHPDLKKIEILGYRGKSLPLWTSNIAVQLNNLMEIKLEDCSELEELPSLGQLPNLKYLDLSNLTNVKSIGPSFYGINNCGNNISNNGVCTIYVVFPALKSLNLWHMKNLKEWDEAGDLPLQTIEVMVVFPRLEHLMIGQCKQLKSAPSHFPCLQELEIYGMESGLPLKNICGMKLTTLTHLSISSIKGLECLPDGLFSNNRNLSKLDIFDCWSLRELPDDIHSLNSLQTLCIKTCPDLKSIPYPSSRGGKLTLLRELKIERCAGLANLPIELVESCALTLEKLSLRRLRSLTNISEVIGCLHKMTCLTDLYIDEVPKFSIGSGIQMVSSSLKSLGMGPSDSDSSWNNVSFKETVDAMLMQFTSLRHLDLSGMEDWECLPDGIQHLTSLQSLYLCHFGIQVLPEWLGNLSSLQRLQLSYCGIEALPEWFGNLSSLETLDLHSCNKLRHFPSKQAMQRLSKLTTLSFCNCPLLLKEKRSKLTSLCIKEEGSNNKTEVVVDSEWHKISHIPTIYMEYEPLN